MIRKIMIALIAGVALAGAPSAQAAMHGGGGFGGGHVGGGFAGGHVGGSFGASHFGGSFGGTRLGGGFGTPHVGSSLGSPRPGGQAFRSVGPNVAAARGHFDHNRGLGLDHDRGLSRHFDHRRRFVAGFGYSPDWDYSYSYYGDGCSYGYPYRSYYRSYYNLDDCYLP